MSDFRCFSRQILDLDPDFLIVAMVILRDLLVFWGTQTIVPAPWLRRVTYGLVSESPSNLTISRWVSVELWSILAMSRYAGTPAGEMTKRAQKHESNKAILRHD